MSNLRPTRGKVYLVGAGPGDPGLITWRGVQCLQRADVVLYDYLANPTLLHHTRADAEKTCLGRHGHGRLLAQQEINQLMITHAAAGRTVVRLKGGDPAVFGRLGEEIAALQQAGIPYEVVPGITAALAASSYAGVSVTDRQQASCVALITGREQEDKQGSRLDYAALAAFPGTLVFYMGVTTARQWSEALISAGKPASTPAIIVRRCTWPDQRVLRCTLGNVAVCMETSRLRPPVITIVGETAGVADEVSWFADRPLFGRRILVTRAATQAAELTELLAEQGAACLFQPAIQIQPVSDTHLLDQTIEQLDKYDWLVFSSTNGVEHFFNRLIEIGRDLRAVSRHRIAAIGPGTAATLQNWHLHADVVPEQFEAQALADAVVAAISDSTSQRLLLIRANRGREVLAETLTAAGHAVEQVVTYESIDVAEPDAEILKELRAGSIELITVTSSAIARSLVSMFGEDLRKVRMASISPITSEVLRELGYTVAIEATEYTMPGLVDAIFRDSTTDT
ncbi:MAG: uroporphyrinogen-III C-methyltransferase [Planctomycetota bacterium]|nr:uroporphyrinogen-III C-methyltransferase [Planctomycetota bacterium]